MQHLTLTDDERQNLRAWARRPKTAQRLAIRSRIVLACIQGQDNVAVKLGVNRATVGKWRRLLDTRPDGLCHEPWPAAPAAWRSSPWRLHSGAPPKRLYLPRRLVGWPSDRGQ
jgi:hypothetical protein